MQASRRFPLFFVLLLIIVGLALFFIFRSGTKAAFGPAVALCPGPDLYGYTCASGAGFAYIDATNDTFLYQDDGAATLELPFPFTFYGTVYTEITAVSNGNLQFGNTNPQYSNRCLVDKPAPDMGDMIAPFWDDLDLRFYGFLETETIGAEPDRIFVIEWDDVPRFGDDSEDRVTFEAQLFEGSNDIVFLYEDVTLFMGNNGSSATIGLQSEAQGLALQYGCDQPVVANASSIYFPHPAEPNGNVGQDTAAVPDGAATPQPAAKGLAAELIATINHRGPTFLTRLRGHWLSQTPARASEWLWVDLTGNGRDELLLLWHGTQQYPELTQLVVLAAGETGQMSLLLDQRLSTRPQPLTQVVIYETADLTHDGHPDAVLQDPTSGQLFILTAVGGADLNLYPIPERCQGSLGLLDANNDGLLEIARDGCKTGRVIVAWNGREFAPVGQ